MHMMYMKLVFHISCCAVIIVLSAVKSLSYCFSAGNTYLPAPQ